jgi:hypothetical protein
LMVTKILKYVLKTVNNKNVATNSLRISEDMSKNEEIFYFIYFFHFFKKFWKWWFFFKKKNEEKRRIFLFSWVNIWFHGGNLLCKK